MPSSKTDSAPELKQIIDLPLSTTPAICKGRTFIVTGASTGLGYEAAKHLVLAGAAKVIMACRSLETGEKARKEILDAITSAYSPTTQTVLEAWPLDLSSYASVTAFASRANKDLDRLDVVIQNAGIAASDPSHFAEGHRVTTTVNVLGTTLLGLLLLPKLTETAKCFYSAPTDGSDRLESWNRPHMAFVSSSAGHSMPSAAWDSIRGDAVTGLDKMDNVFMVYPLSKILITQVIRYLGSSVAPLDRTGVVLNVLCPGLCTTSLDRHAPEAFRTKLAADRAEYGRTAEQGSRTLLHGATAGAESHGQYLSDARIADDKLPDWLSSDNGELCWKTVADELEKAVPGCVKAVEAL